jgi:hypothetical protein
MKVNLGGDIYFSITTCIRREVKRSEEWIKLQCCNCAIEVS